MRLVSIALLGAWLMAWMAAPHGEVARQTSIVGAVACAGGDEAALGWLELRHGAMDGTLHVVTADEQDRVSERLRMSVGVDATAFRLADAGGGVFVLATEHRSEAGRYIELHRFGPGVDDFPPVLRSGPEAGTWQIAAAGDELIVSEEMGDLTRLHVLGPDGQWLPAEYHDRALIGAGGGHVISYSVISDHNGWLMVARGRDGSWGAQVAAPSCMSGARAIVSNSAAAPSLSDGRRAPTITSVVGLRGGYARLSRRGDVGCVDGLRDGKPFAYRDVPLAGIAAARLSVDGDGRLSVYEEQDAQLTRRRVILPLAPGGTMAVDPSTIVSRADDGVRYRLFGGDGRLGTTTLATRVLGSETQVVLERSGGPGGHNLVLAPVRHYQPDHRPVLRWLAALPIGLLLLSLLGSLRLLFRLRRFSPLPREAALSAGAVTIEGELARDAEAPAGGLPLLRNGQRLWLFVEGAKVLRASEVRPRSQPRGDAVDVASGAAVFATGTIEPATLYRAEATLRARAGDLVIVGCTLAEARTRVVRRVATSLALIGTALTVVLALSLH